MSTRMGAWALLCGRSLCRSLARASTWSLVLLLRLYQNVVSPWFPRTCRYYPTCSGYAVTALTKHGPIKGAVLSIWRLLRCNPWSSGGIDPVPEEWPRSRSTGDRPSASGSHRPIHARVRPSMTVLAGQYSDVHRHIGH